MASCKLPRNMKSKYCQNSLSFRRGGFLLGLGIIFSLTAVCALSEAETTRYFASIFGSESKPKKAKLTHTFAYVVKATGTGEGIENYTLELDTISWMPAAMVIKPHRFIPEEGVNMKLKDTLKWALETDQQIMQWGPYEIPEASYSRAMNRIAELDSGKVKYQCIDPLFFRARRVSDCIHGVSDMDPSAGRFRYLLIRFGEDASRHIVSRAFSSSVLIDPEKTHPWINQRLGLDQFPIVHKQLP